MIPIDLWTSCRWNLEGATPRNASAREVVRRCAGVGDAATLEQLLHNPVARCYSDLSRDCGYDSLGDMPHKLRIRQTTTEYFTSSLLDGDGINASCPPFLFHSDHLA